MFEKYYIYKLNKRFNRINRIIERKTEAYVNYVYSFEEFEHSLANVYYEAKRLEEEYKQAYKDGNNDEDYIKSKIQLYVTKWDQYNILLERFNYAKKHKDEMINQIKSLNFDKNAIDAKKQMLEAEIHYIRSNNMKVEKVKFDDVFKEIDNFVNKNLYEVKAEKELSSYISPKDISTKLNVDDIYEELKKNG